MLKTVSLLLCVLLLGGLSVLEVNADPITLHFTNNEVNLGTGSVINLAGNEFSAFGLTMTNIYRYVDGRDPFSDAPNQISGSNVGIAAQIGSSGLGRIDFDSDTPSVTFDWWTISGTFNLRAFDSSNNLVGSFLGGVGSGTNTITGPVSYITFNDAGGFIAIANLSYDLGSTSVPEPASLLLLSAGIIVLAGGRRHTSWKSRG
ncbi:MAG: PEP-CTERM sorting domain-containing protein [Acidobacteria bacterium]|nr:PEP-CTERM sorting domain-containing protein [Acidobacteriota bacterium]MCI0723253.1 PEP-CTERM sorting domain-containing protein [Acidobacteriota bacterium]